MLNFFGIDRVSGFSSFFLANKLEYFTRRPLPLKCDQLQTLNNSFVPLEKPATSRRHRLSHGRRDGHENGHDPRGAAAAARRCVLRPPGGDRRHCGLPVDNLVTLATKLLDVDKALVRAALDHELAGAEVVGDTIGGEACVFLRGLHIAERGVAERLRSLVRGPLPWPAIDVEKALPWVEKKTGKMLAASQRAAIEMALRSKAMVITGGPGVGKTTLLDAILRILAAKGTKVLLAAPTGRAAKRMTEQTGIEAKTIHRLLEIDSKSGGFRRGADNPLDCDLLVIDETSMVDISLMFSLVKAVPARSALLLVGDVDQLPSVARARF